MNILIDVVRIHGFRGLENIEVTLEPTTILTGMNNTGKTSFLKALQLALGNRLFVSQDDFFIHENLVSEKITIDLRIIPLGEDGQQCEDFLESWEELFTTDRIQIDGAGNSFIPLRTVISFDAIKNSFKTQQFIMQAWPSFEQGGANWFAADNGSKSNFHFEEVPFFYIDAQRDILDDTKSKSSYLGKMLSKIKYSKEAIEEIENQIQTLNDKAVGESDILSNLKATLKALDTAIGAGNDGIEITPFTKKIRDLSKGLTIYYTDRTDSFSMEYHGMGTRSWSSLLTLKSFISLLSNNAENDGTVFFPVLTIEEPEAHLHPNAQKKLYRQLDGIGGQKIISTHSPYIAAAAELNQIRNFYKGDAVACGKIDTANLDSNEIRKINRQVINTRGEIFFSKVIVLFEGETEEQALPILAQKYFDKTPVEIGVDFIGVGGHGNYLPFLRFAESLNIPWIIFSDADNLKIKASVQNQYQNSGSSRREDKCIVFLDDNNDFERQLITDGFQDEIKKAIISFDRYSNEQHRATKEAGRLVEVTAFNDEKLYEIITNDKTQYGPAIAEQIAQCDKPLPPNMVLLCEKISAFLNNLEGTE